MVLSEAQAVVPYLRVAVAAVFWVSALVFSFSLAAVSSTTSGGGGGGGGGGGFKPFPPRLFFFSGALHQPPPIKDRALKTPPQIKRPTDPFVCLWMDHPMDCKNPAEA